MGQQKSSGLYGNIRNPESPKPSGKKKQGWRYHSVQLQIILQSDNNQNSMVLAEKQTHRPMKQNGESRSKPIFIWANSFRQKRQKHMVEKGKPLQ